MSGSTPASLTSLPLDILLDILAYLPRCARFTVISRVCQRLRQAVPASVRTMSEAEFVMLCRLVLRTPSLGPSLTNLRALHIGTGAEAALLRMPLHRVRSIVCYSPGPGAQVAAHLSSLTSIEILPKGFSFIDPNQCSLLSRNASTLTSLRIPQTGFSTRVSLPHLRSLASDYVQNYETLPATCLTRLDCLVHVTPLQAHLWPALRSLALDVRDDVAIAAPFVLALHSQLTSLTLRNVNSGDAECRLIAQLTCLTDIHFTRSEPEDLPRLRHALAHTKLRRVSPLAPLLPLADLFGPHLTKLNLQQRSGRVPPTDGTLTTFTNLTSLTIPDLNMHHLSAWRLPHLRKLKAVFTPYEDGFYAAIRNLTRALSQLPSLRRLTLRPTYEGEDFSEAISALFFEEALALCRDRGVDVCVHVANVANARPIVPSHPWVTVAVHKP